MRSWAIPAAVIVTIEYGVALLIGASVGFHYSIPFAAYMISGVAVGSIAAFVVLAVRLARGGDQRPMQQVRAEVAEIVLGCVLVALQMAVLSWLKIMLPIAHPFWADPLLADVDATLFRTDPWHLSHAAFSWASPAIDRAYVTWAPVKFATLLALLCAPASASRARLLVSYFLIMAAAALGQYLLPSAGPLFYSPLGLGDRFADLPLEPWVRSASNYLWVDYQRAGGHIGTGISAFPSLHVAIALWLAFVARAYLPRVQLVGWIFFVLIFVGSIHLGWHYGVDSLAACGMTLAALALGRLWQQSERDRSPRLYRGQIGWIVRGFRS